MNFEIGTGEEAQKSELPALKQMINMGYTYKSPSELNKTRRKCSEVLLYDRLEKAIKRLNPELDKNSINDAVSQLAEDKYIHSMPPVDTNEKIRAKLIGLSRTDNLKPVVITQDFGNGLGHKTIKIFDFDVIENNDFLVTNQFRIQGSKTSIYPDIVIFVNGIPLAIIECKSPTIPNPIEQAYDNNLKHYQSKGNGYEKIFFYNHCIIATCGMQARVGTLQSNINHYAKWTTPYPLSIDEVETMCNRKPREQEILIAGLLSKQNLLNHLQNFVVYETVNSQKIKKIAKHQQFRVVTKSISRLKESTKIKDKGGIIWHTQGSGKSLSMLWFASQLMYKYGNPPIVIVTDRRQLDKQIHETFKNCGFPAPIKATDGRHLSDLLNNPKGKTIMTVLDKFATDSQIHTDENVICLVDEAHRSQFKTNAEQMRNAMPNAVFFGFTGTPIEKEDRSVYKVFGPMLDKYGFKESQNDNATIPIKYEGRLPKLSVEGGDTIEQVYDRVIGRDSSIDSELKEQLKKRYVTKDNIAESPSRIKMIALDITEHYTSHIEPNEYKAIVVAPSREAAVIYKREFDRLNAPFSKIIMDSHLGENGKDGLSWDEYFLNPKQRETEAEQFKKPEDPTKILIVVDMLLVGYDVPICQVLYLDRGIREHNLLQAIARVNRLYNEAKTHGLIIDYYGITKDLQKALEVFDKKDIDGALEPLEDTLHELHDRHLDTMAYFKGIDRDDDDSIIEKFEPEDLRHKFEYDFKMFARALDRVMPDKSTHPYIEDFKFAGATRQMLHTRYKGVLPSTRPYAKKIQQLIDEHVRARGIAGLVDLREVSPENFLVFVQKDVKSDKAKAALIKQRAISVIKELTPNNPAFYENLRELLQRLIDEEEERRKENADYFTNPELYKEIYNKALSEEEERKKVFGEYKANPFEFALYGELCKENTKEQSIEITKEIYNMIKLETELVDWKNKTSVEKNIRATVYKILNEEKFEDVKIEEISDNIITQARNNL